MKKEYRISILIIILIVLLMTILSMSYLAYIQNLTDENTLKNLGELAKQDAVKIENQITKHKIILETLVEQIDKKQNISEKEIFDLYENNIANYEFSRLGIMHKNGETITSDGEIVDLSEDVDDFFAKDEIIVSKSRKSKVDQEEINIYSKKIEINKEKIAILLVLETNKYEEIFAESIYNGKGYEYIINSEGEIIANSKERSNGYNIFNVIGTLKDKYNQQQLNKMKNEISDKKDGQVKYKVSGIDYYTSYKYLGVNDWNLVILTPGSLVAQEYNKSLRVTFIVSIVINTFVLVIAIYIVISNKKKKEKLYELAYIDQLTKLGNSNYFFENCEKRLKENSNPKYLILVDIDKFKMFNKKYGREIGDELLKNIALKIKEMFGDNQLISRITNDNFAILYEQDKKGKKINNVSEIAKKISEELTNVEIREREYPIIVSIGIYEINKEDTNIFEIFDKTLMAHSMAKGNSNVKYYIFNEKLEQDIVKEHEIESIMEEGIEKREFEVYYQPKVDSKTEKVNQAEALVRWKRNGKYILPNEFIPVFEKNKFIVKLDEYIYEQVCANIKEWKEKYNRKIIVSVNVSKEHLIQEDFIDRYVSIAKKYEIEPKEIELEITESAELSEEFTMMEVLKEVKENGFKVSIDDFGTGYSSLNMLQNMPVDVLKIDKSFIEQEKMLGIIILISKKLNLETVAEGVETEEQVRRLKKLGVDLLQGYYYSKPLEKLKFEEYWDCH